MKIQISRLARLSVVFVLVLFMLGGCAKDTQKSKKKSEGLFPVKSGGRWGYIDKQGKIVINPQFDRAWDFLGGLAWVMIGDKLGYIDKEGKYVWSPQN
jgi:hypothetical protein